MIVGLSISMFTNKNKQLLTLKSQSGPENGRDSFRYCKSGPKNGRESGPKNGSQKSKVDPKTAGKSVKY